MDQWTVSLKEEQAETIEEKIGGGKPYESKSDAIRSIIDEHEERREQIRELETENERLHNERQTIIEDREERIELREYVEEERSWRQAGLRKRMKWWLFGKDE